MADKTQESYSKFLYRLQIPRMFTDETGRIFETKNASLKPPAVC